MRSQNLLPEGAGPPALADLRRFQPERIAGALFWRSKLAEAAPGSFRCEGWVEAVLASMVINNLDQRPHQD
ncbi:MAG: hypothetical protein ACKOS8_17060, partial [Gemmataceae bacterium]